MKKNIKNAVAHNANHLDTQELTLAGLNLQAILNIKDLPPAITQQIQSSCTNFQDYSQLILIAHGGQLLWQKLQKCHFDSTNPIDDYSYNKTKDFFSNQVLVENFQILFPSKNSHPLINLQALGELVGWHNNSPFKIGINQQWGSWFAYRALVLTKSDFQTSCKQRDVSPCISCIDKPCIRQCPAQALTEEDYKLDVCLAYRREINSKCQDRCIARMACPVAKEQQYSLQQIQYHYNLSYHLLTTETA